MLNQWILFFSTWLQEMKVQFEAQFCFCLSLRENSCITLYVDWRNFQS